MVVEEVQGGRAKAFGYNEREKSKAWQAYNLAGFEGGGKEPH